tara:strand:- start:1489 stop:2373 length:885 start_codon:yes stop_codon:yes gene_type:complete
MAKHYTIRLKLVVPLAIFMIGVAIFNAIYFPTQQSELINENFRAQLENNIEVLSLGTSVSIMAHYLDGASATVDRVAKDENLAFLLVLDQEGEELLRRGAFTESQIDDATLVNLQQGELTQIENYLILKDYIMFDEEVLGTAIIGLNTTERYKEINWIVAVSLLINALLVAVGIGFILYILKMGKDFNSLIGQTQQSGIQITSSVTQIMASSKQMEASTHEQASSASDVAVTSKEISATSQTIDQPLEEVAAKAQEMGLSADSAYQGLSGMESTIKKHGRRYPDHCRQTEHDQR